LQKKLNKTVDNPYVLAYNSSTLTNKGENIMISLIEIEELLAEQQADLAAQEKSENSEEEE
jgi:hypothetical protein